MNGGVAVQAGTSISYAAAGCAGAAGKAGNSTLMTVRLMTLLAKEWRARLEQVVYR